MHRILPAAPVAASLSLLLAGCGGGGIKDNNPQPAPVPAYHFVTPRAGVHLAYAATLVDNLGNTVNRTVTEDVTALNADGSFAVHQEDPSHNTVFSGATDQTVYPTDTQYNAAGAPTAFTVSKPSASVRCTIAGSAGAPATLANASDWNTSWTQSCSDAAAVGYTQSGTLSGIESVTVPAGTFNAYKFQSSTSSTVNGLTRTETTTRWRVADGSDSRIVKEASVFTYSGGTAPAGAALQAVRLLQSYR